MFAMRTPVARRPFAFVGLRTDSIDYLADKIGCVVRAFRFSIRRLASLPLWNAQPAESLLSTILLGTRNQVPVMSAYDAGEQRDWIGGDFQSSFGGSEDVEPIRVVVVDDRPFSFGCRVDPIEQRGIVAKVCRDQFREDARQLVEWFLHGVTVQSPASGDIRVHATCRELGNVVLKVIEKLAWSNARLNAVSTLPRCSGVV